MPRRVCRKTSSTVLVCMFLVWLTGQNVQAQAQYVVVNLAPSEVSPSVFEQIHLLAMSRTPGQVHLGVGAIFSYLNQTREESVAHVTEFLTLAERYCMPIVIQLDGEQWWAARPDLWNWWDPARPGYNPENCKNVEWSGWGPKHALKIAWRNWGRQIRVLPPPNFMSQAYRKACHDEMRVLVPLILNWWQALPREKKNLLIGIKLGWESAIGVNSFYYPNGNAMLNQPETEDPQTGLKADQIPGRGVTAIGYAAVTTTQLAQDGQLQEADLVEIVRRHLTDLCALAAALGVPRERLFTHVAGWKEEELLYGAALNPYACPGWSFYRYASDPAGDKGVQRGLRHSDAPFWAAVEWLLMGSQDQSTWYRAMNRTLSDPKCRYLCIYNWSSIKANESAIHAIQQLLETK